MFNPPTWGQLGQTEGLFTNVMHSHLPTTPNVRVNITFTLDISTKYITSAYIRADFVLFVNLV